MGFVFPPLDVAGDASVAGADAGEIRVREIGASGEGTAVEHAVSYPRAGGTVFWAAVPGGLEEWLHRTSRAMRRPRARTPS